MSFALYADVEGLLRSPLLQGLTPTVFALAQASLEPKQMQCMRDVLGGAREVLVGAKERDELFIIRFDEAVANPTACLAVSNAELAPLPGAPDSYKVKRNRVAHLPGLLLVGSEALVTKAVQQAAPKPISEGLTAVTLGDDQYLAFHVGVPGLGSGTGGLIASASRFRIDLDAELPEPIARNFEEQMNEQKATAMRGAGEAAGAGEVTKDQAAILSTLARAVTLSRTGGHVTLAFDLEEPVVDQARDVGGVGALAVFSVRKYIANAKEAEARNVVGQLAKDYQTAWERESLTLVAGPGKKKTPKAVTMAKLVAFPAVPKTVPRGMKYQSSVDDWKPWDLLKFSMDSPQYYQYEIVVAKDGKSGDILARGDLTGAGTTSLFKLHLAVDPKDHSLHVSPKIEETDPDE